MTTAKTAVGGAAGAQSLAIGIDVGGTKIAAGVVSSAGRILEQLRIPTADSGPELPQVLAGIVDELRVTHPGVVAVGVGAAGLVEWPAGYIRWAPNNSYRHLPLQAQLGDATGLPTIVDNDANTAAWAEAHVRSEGGFSDLVYVTVGTGVGGGIVLGGEMYRGRSGLGAEIGHLVVDPAGPRCSCGNFGCLEAMASGTALERLARAAVRDEPHSYLAELVTRSDKRPGSLAFEAARHGDPIAVALFEDIGYWLGVGAASLANIFEVEAIVVGGGVSETGELLLAPARRSYRRHVFAAEHRGLPPILGSVHGSDAGVVGAADLALSAQRAAVGAL